MSVCVSVLCLFPVGRKFNILVVDDSQMCRTMTCKSLVLIGKQNKFSVCYDEAGNGQTAINCIQHCMTEKHSQTPTQTPSDNNSNNSNNENEQNRHSEEESTTPTTTTTDAVLVEVVCKNIYDVIFMDYEMPHMNGPTAIQMIRALGYQGKIIGLTGNSKSDEIDIMYKAGANEVLTKPVSYQRLDETLMNILSSY